MRRVLVLSVLLGLLPAGTAQAFVSCPHSATGPRLTAVVDGFAPLHGPETARLVVCDHRTARRIVVRRALVVNAPRMRGTMLGDAVAVRDGRVWWMEAHGARRGTTETLRTADALHPARRRTARTVARLRPGVPAHPEQLGVVLLADGSPVVLTTTPSGGQRLTNDRTRRDLARGSITDIAVEDGWTLRWAGRDDDFRFLDLKPPRQRHGCPARGLWTAVLDTPEVLITSTTYGDETFGKRVVRACVRGSGRDRVLDQGGASEGPRDAYVTATGTWVFAVRIDGDRYEGCVVEFVHTFDLAGGRTGRALPRTTDGCDRGRAPRSAGDAAISPAGVPAWIAMLPDGEARVRSIAPDGTLLDLDAGPPDALSNVRADGDGFTWTHDGAERHAVAT